MVKPHLAEVHQAVLAVAVQLHKHAKRPHRLHGCMGNRVGAERRDTALIKLQGSDSEEQVVKLWILVIILILCQTLRPSKKGKATQDTGRSGDVQGNGPQTLRV